MTSTPDLPPCPARVFVDLIGGLKILCRHPRVHAAGNAVPAAVCLDCAHIAEPAELRPIEGLGDEPGPAIDYAACIHRGQVALRSEPCELCGQQGKREAVYSCDVFGECSLRRFKAGRGPASCLGCPQVDLAISPGE